MGLFVGWGTYLLTSVNVSSGMGLSAEMGWRGDGSRGFLKIKILTSSPLLDRDLNKK